MGMVEYIEASLLTTLPNRIFYCEAHGAHTL